MQKSFICLALVFFPFLSVLSNPIDSATAQVVARNFYIEKVGFSERITRSLPAHELKFRLANREKSVDNAVIGQKIPSEKTLCYIFNVDNDEGFVIVSGDDRVTPILGYSLKGNYQKDNPPPAFQEWLNYCKKEIQYIVENNLQASGTIEAEWSAYQNVEESDATDANATDVGPLLTTSWNQGCYYNEYCPSDSRGPCYRVWAGCVAVAMAQIMNYWQHPATGNDIPGYDDDPNYDSDSNVISGSDYGWISAVSSSSFAWSDMPNYLNYNSSSIQMDAVSELLYHCGVSIEMNYGPEGSSASSFDVDDALKNYFNYSSTTQIVSKSSYTATGWLNLLKNELNNSRPVYYRGSGSGGHAFVCDGYQGDYFHINWGWGGSYDGYFALTDLTPGSRNYNDYQRAIIGIIPETMSYKISGYVYGYAWAPLSGIEMQGFPETVYTNSEGYYECYVDAGWSGTISPYKENYNFNPASYTYNNVNSNIQTDYDGWIITYSVSGTITESDGTPIEDVLLYGLPFSPTTDENGHYLQAVQIGFTGTVTPQKVGYTFEPISTDYANVTHDIITGYVGYEIKHLSITLGESGWTFPSSSEYSMYNTFGIYSNTDWTITKNADWITLEKTSGSGDDWIRVTINSDNTSTNDRTGIITINGDGVEPETLTVTQLGSDVFLSANVEYLSLGSHAGAGNSFTISSNTNWNKTSDVGWISISPVNGNNNGTVSIGASSANYSTTDRSGTIEISASGANPVLIKIIQDGNAQASPPTVQNVEVCQGQSIPALTASGSDIKWYSTNQSLTVTDRSGNVYRTVAIEDQLWMTENLQTSHYNDGTAIDYVVSNNDWSNLSSGAYCWFNDNPDMTNIYGALYNWHAVNTGKLCPSGWHVPSNAEWDVMVDYFGGSDEAGGKLKNEGTTYWLFPNSDATNESGFNGLPGGFRDIYGDYHEAGEIGWHWAAEGSSVYARVKRLNYYNAKVEDLDWHKINGFSVRCMKNGNDLLAVGENYTPSASAPGTYRYYVTQTIDGIESVKVEVRLVIKPNPVIDLPSSYTACEGETLTLDAGSGFNSYSWNTGHNTQMINVSTAGTYGVTVTNSDGCSASDQSSVSFNPTPSIDISGPSTACEGETATLDAGSGYGSYSWNTGQNTQMINVNAAGTYGVTVTNNYGCSASDQHAVSFYPSPIVNISGTAAACEGETITLDAGSGFSTYNWNTGQNSSMISVNQTGTYSVDVTNSYGCSASDQMDVHFYSLPQMVISGPSSACMGETIVLDAGTDFMNYLWNTGSKSNSIEIKESGEYTVQVMDENYCSNALSKEVIFNPSPEVFLGQDTTIHTGEPLVLNAGTGFYSYYWNTGALEESILLQDLNAGNYMYTVTVTNDFNCTDTDTIMVTVNLPDNIKNYQEKYGIVLFPNPAEDLIMLKSNKPFKEKLILKIINTDGRVSVINEIKLNNSVIEEEINISKLKSGVYFMELRTDRDFVRLRFIKL